MCASVMRGLHLHPLQVNNVVPRTVRMSVGQIRKARIILESFYLAAKNLEVLLDEIERVRTMEVKQDEAQEF